MITPTFSHQPEWARPERTCPKFCRRVESVEWALRIGLAAMYLYSGVDIFLHPLSWTWAIPPWFADAVANIIPIERYLQIQAVGEIVFALAFLSWFLKPNILKYIALVATAEMAGILFLGKTGIDSITFRDLGLLGALVALTLIFYQKQEVAPPKPIP